jgi:signal peptidase I
MTRAAKTKGARNGDGRELAPAGKDAKKEMPPTSRLKRIWRDFAVPVLVTAVVLFTFRSAVADWNDVPTGSMKPTLLEGDRIFVNKLAFGLRVPFTLEWITRWGGPVRGDVVVLFSPAPDGTRLVKRAVGVPGDVIELRDNKLVVNGEPAEYGPLDDETVEQIPEAERARHGFAAETTSGRTHPVMNTPSRPSDRSFGPVTVPAGHYFVMGDNRDESADSRVFGFVPEDRIVGRATGVIFSLDYERMYLPRADRFFRSLP